jgi:cystathionine gamma-synthase
MDDASAPRRANRTLAAQTPEGVDTPPNGLVPPIDFSTAFVRDEHNIYPSSDYVYGRSDNVTLRQAETLIASLEGGSAAMLFTSGTAAAIALILAFDAPIHILAPLEMYYGLNRWFRGAGRFGHSIAFADMTSADAVSAAISARRPDLVWLETPSNVTWQITDVAAIAGLAHAAGAIVCVDSTAATPILTQPLALGADIVMHSATKYLNGHSDVNAGALICARPTALWRRIADMRADQGGGLGAFQAWLLMRGMRTLAIRIQAQSKTALWLAQKLEGHAAVAQVLYPGLESHPGRPIAKKQMTGGFGGMLSLRMCGGRHAAIEAASGMRLWKRATSFGGVESLIEHRFSMEGEGTTCPEDLLRLSVGIEDAEELYQDLDRGFCAIKSSVVRFG